MASNGPSLVFTGAALRRFRFVVRGFCLRFTGFFLEAIFFVANLNYSLGTVAMTPSLTVPIDSMEQFSLFHVIELKTMLDLEGFLKDNNVWHRFMSKPETVHTADASRETGIDLSRITKNLVCRDNNGQFALLVIPGDRRVNIKKAAEALNTTNVKLLSFAEAESVSGYPPGGTPSIHHKTKMTVVLDKSLLSRETIFCGGGTRDRLLELRTEDVVRMENAVVAEISE
jgi:Cys-tRNA(Pro) deacylase